MFIPLDNIYEWIAGQFPDTLIYRFFPHGQKNLADINMVDQRYTRLSWYDYMSLVPVLCHDQEPLNHALYQVTAAQLQQSFSGTWPAAKEFEILQENPQYWQWLADRNLLAAVRSNIHDRVVLLHSEHNSAELDRYQDTVVGAFWWSHAMIARDWYRFAAHDVRLVQDPSHQFQLDFNIYARAWTGTREYRLKFLELLLANDLAKSSRVTFDHWDHEQHYQTHRAVNPRLQATQSLDAIESQCVPATSSATYDPEHYQQCAIDVVLETLFDDTRIQLTEKILRPIACGQPFMLVSTPGSLAMLKSYGFQTFGTWINESYDAVQDPVERLEAVIAEMNRIRCMTPGQKHELWSGMLAVAQFNKRHFFSERFARHIINELVTHLGQAREQVLEHYQTGHNWQHERSLMTVPQRLRVNQYLQAAVPDYRTSCAEMLCRFRRQR